MAPGFVFVPTRANGRTNLWVLDAATHKATPLTSGEGGDFRPSWSPDGSWIAFCSDRDRDGDVPPAKGRWERLHLVLSHHGLCHTGKKCWVAHSSLLLA